MTEYRSPSEIATRKTVTGDVKNRGESRAIRSSFFLPVMCREFAMKISVSRDHGLVMPVMRGFRFAATLELASHCDRGTHDQGGHARRSSHGSPLDGCSDRRAECGARRLRSGTVKSNGVPEHCRPSKCAAGSTLRGRMHGADLYAAASGGCYEMRGLSLNEIFASERNRRDPSRTPSATRAPPPMGSHFRLRVIA
jgi:hypothetical protein